MLRKSVFRLLVIILSLISLVLAGCGGRSDDGLTFSQLISQADKYNGDTVTLEAFYFVGFEIAVICESVGPAQYDSGRLVPNGTLVWVDKGISEELFNKLYIQNKTPSGYPEHIGKLKIMGKFEAGGKYGHMNAYQYKISFTSAEIEAWSPWIG
jgi:hypothetical protein